MTDKLIDAKADLLRLAVDHGFDAIVTVDHRLWVTVGAA